MSVWKDKRPGVGWRFEFEFQKRRITGSGYKTRREALSEQEKRKKAEKKSSLTPDVMAFRDLANIYLDHAERNFTAKTYKGKVRVCKAFQAVNGGDIPIDQITPLVVKNVLDIRPTNNNFNAYRKDLSAVFQYAVDVLRVLQYNPVTPIPQATHDASPKAVPTEKAVLQLVMAANPQTDERDLLLTLLYTLARIDEVLRLKWDDVNFQNQTIIKWTRKRKGGAYAPIPVKMQKDLKEILWKRWQEREQGVWVFYNSKTGTRFFHRPKFMKGLCKRAGVPHIGFHTLRHYMATLLADNPKIGTTSIQHILGHQSPKTTQIYVHSVDSSVADAMDSLDGKFTQISENPTQNPTQEIKKASGENPESLD